MQISARQSDLRRALDLAVPATGSTGVLSHVFMSVESNQVRMTAGNEETSVSISLPCEVKRAGALALPAAPLRDYVSNLPSGSVTLRAEKDAHAFIEAVAGASARISAVSNIDYPLPAKVVYEGVSLPASDFLALVEAVSFAVAHDSARPQLCGVYVLIQEDRVTLGATDGHRLSRASFTLAGQGAEPRSAIVPVKALGMARKLFDPNGMIEVGFSSDGESRIGFRQAGAEMVSRLIDGMFPAIERVIPAQSTTTAIVDRLALQQVVQRVVVLASDRTHRVEMNFGGEEVHLGGERGDLGGARDRLPAEVHGAGVTVYVNGDYLLKILSRIPGDRVVIKLGDPLKPVHIMPERGGIPDAWKLDCVLMPLKP